MSIKSLNKQTFTNKSFFNSTNLTGGGTAAPVISSIVICDSSFNNLDDTALDTAGSYVKLIGSGFVSGCTVYFNNQSITATFISSSEVRIQTPATTVGSYNIMLFNPDDGGAIYLNLSVSSGPSWSTSSGTLGTVYETKPISASVVATGDVPITYSLFSGSLPDGTTLSSDGTLSGTAAVEPSSTTYAFTIKASDAQNQDVTRSFSLTINVDVVTWSTPSDSQVITAYEYAPISNVTLLATAATGYDVQYSANTLPSGITLSGNTISGTNNTVGNTFTRLTATANTTGRSAVRDIVFNVNQDVVTWSSPADATSYLLTGGSPISNVSLAATSAAGRTISYTANALPSGLSLSGSTISGTPDAAQTVTTLLTATAATTNRSATRTISWSISLGDSLWKQTTLLLNATTPSTNTFINDASLRNSTLTIAGDVKPSNFSPYDNGYYGMVTGTTGAHCLTFADNNALRMGTSDFTIEGWFIPTGSGNERTVYIQGVNSAGGLALFVGTGGARFRSNGQTDVAAAVTISDQQYTHIAFVRSGTTRRIFINGTLAASDTLSFNNNDSATVDIGAPSKNASDSFRFYGSISNFRVTKGQALYSGTFTPSTTPLTAYSVGSTGSGAASSLTGTVSLLLFQNNSHTVDSSNNRFIPTVSGTPVTNASHPFVTPTTAAYNTLYSTYFDGTGDYLTIPASASMAFGSGDFTIEAWIYTPSTVTQFGSIICNSSSPNGWYLSFSTSNFITFSNYGTVAITSSSAVTLNQWTHVAVTRSGTSLTMFFNGVSVGSATNSTVYGDSSATNYIGLNGTSAHYTGLISNLRVLKGTALYTSSFTAPTSPLTAITNTSLLTCQSSTTKDNSTNNFTITSFGQAQPVALSPFTMTTSNITVTSLGSAYFDGTGDYLVVPASPAHGNLGSSDFTVECWFYTTTIAASIQYIISHRLAGFVPFLLWLETNSLKLYASSDNGSWNLANSQTLATIFANQWYHLAYTRSGSSFRVFLNGVQVHTFTSSASLTTTTNTLNIGGSVSDTNAIFNGYISDVRLVKGTALYTANFLPPQTPLTSVTNTQLLTCQYNGGVQNNSIVDQSNYNNPITRNGNATQGTFSPYSQTGWSNFFNGTGDWLSIDNNSALALGSGNFTFECWVYLTGTAIPTTAGVYDQRNGTNGAGVVQPVVELTSSSGYAWYVTAANRISSGSAAVKLNQWQHIAVSRVSGSTRMYIDGVQVGSTYTDSNNYPAGSITIARENDGSSTRYFPGYISNLRTIAGTGLYSGTSITVPTSPLEPVANTVLLTCQDNRFIDKSFNSVNVTTSGTPLIQAFSPFSGVTSLPASYSNYFDGNGDYLTTSTNTAFTYGTSDFTIEMWVYITANPGDYAYIYSQGPNTTASMCVYIQGGVFRVWNGSGIITGSTSYSLKTWYHVALSRSGTSLKLFVNGVLDGSVTNSSNVTTGSTYGVNIGRWVEIADTREFTGYISNLRVNKGQALYTTNFTPSTSPLTTTSQSATAANVSLLTCQSSTLVDNSTNYHALTVAGDVKPRPFNPFGQTTTTQVSYSPSVNGGSMYFDGTADYLVCPASANISGTGYSWTIEGWFYAKSVNLTKGIIDGWNGGAGTSMLLRLNGGNFEFYVTGGSNIGVSGMLVNRWYHFALVKDVNNSNTIQAYLNGNKVGTAIVNYTTSITSNIFGIGGSSNNGSEAFDGYLSDIKITKGAALYTSNFYPPVSPLTPTTIIGANTTSSSLLLTGTSAGIIDAHSSVNFETLGNVTLSSENPYEENYYSNYFDGTGDYLTVPDNAGLQMGSGDFTIEFWINYNSITGYQTPFSKGYTAAGDILLQTGNGNGIMVVYLSGSAVITESTGAVIGQWYHYALVRSGTTVTLYRDGVSRGTATSSVNFNTTDQAGIGATGKAPGGNIVGAFAVNGYMSNVRVVKGTAIVPPVGGPTSPLTAVSGTQLLTCQSNKYRDNSTNNFTLTRNGNASVVSFNPFRQNTGKSLYFDGTGDYLMAAVNNQSLNFGNSDFCVEFWMKTTATAFLVIGNTGASWQIAATGSSLYWVTSYNTANLMSRSLSGYLDNAWHHFMIRRVSGVTYMYFDGVQQGAGVSDTTNYAPTATIGVGYTGTAYTAMNGYIADLRVTKGNARTANTAPTTAYTSK